MFPHPFTWTNLPLHTSACLFVLISFIERVKTSIALATEPLIRGLELVENVVLKLLHLDNEAVLLLDEIVAKVEEVGPLFLHDQVQQLILETCLGDGEIDQCRLG